MTNDINTLNGSLMELGDKMADNLTSMGVEADAEDGLTTLAEKVLDIEPSVSGIGLITDIDATFSDTAINLDVSFPCKLTATFDDETLTNVDLAQGVLTGATLLLKEGNNTLTSGITDSNGEVTLTTSFATDGTRNLKILFEGTDNFEACEITDSIYVAETQVLFDDTTPSAEHLRSYYTYNQTYTSYDSSLKCYLIRKGYSFTTNTLHSNLEFVKITITVSTNNSTYINRCKITYPWYNTTKNETITLTTSKTTRTYYAAVQPSGDFYITLQGGKDTSYTTSTTNYYLRVYNIKIEEIVFSQETIWKDDCSTNRLNEYNTSNDTSATYDSENHCYIILGVGE